jgi:twitching motility protein PilT
MTGALAGIRLAETLHVARLRNASDIHLAPGAAPVLRVDGALEPQSSVALTAEELEALSSALLDERARAVLDARGDVTVSYNEPGMAAGRIHAYRTASGITLAIRLLRVDIPPLESLHLPAVTAQFVQHSQGLIIFAGPTGSGKSTALAAIVDCINRTQSKHIVTIEDPIEYRHPSAKSVVTQREIGTDVESYAAAIYGALRSDPDVILIGELREADTMHAALTAAETGHLVLTTLHTGDAPQTIDRIVGAFAGPRQDQIRIQLAQTLIAVVCVRLVPRLTAQGRRIAAEVMIVNDAVRTLIRDAKSHQLRNVISTSRPIGMQTLEMHLSELIERREVSLESARAVCGHPGDVRCTEAAAS